MATRKVAKPATFRTGAVNVVPQLAPSTLDWLGIGPGGTFDARRIGIDVNGLVIDQVTADRQGELRYEPKDDWLWITTFSEFVASRGITADKIPIWRPDLIDCFAREYQARKREATANERGRPAMSEREPDARDDMLTAIMLSVGDGGKVIPAIRAAREKNQRAFDRMFPGPTLEKRLASARAAFYRYRNRTSG